MTVSLWVSRAVGAAMAAGFAVGASVAQEPGKRSPPRVVEPDSTATASPDSTVHVLPASFRPEAPGWRPFLVPTPDATADSLELLSVFDTILLPPVGPASFYDRTDIRLAEQADGWDILRDAAGAFAFPAGYPGTSSPLSFRGRGAAGSKLVYGHDGFGGPARPQELVHVVPRGVLSGMAVMPVSASHLYGPGAGAGAVHFARTAQAPTRAFSEVSNRTGVFGQSGGSITSSARYGRLGVLINYDANRARAWSLFGGYRAERFHGQLDYIRSGWRIRATARLADEKLKGFLEPDKRSEEGGSGELSIERALGERSLVALRAGRERHLVRADGAAGRALDLAWTTWIDAAWAHTGDRTSIGVLGGLAVERRTREAVGERVTAKEPGGYALVRGTMQLDTWKVDGALRGDRLPSGQSSVAPGVTVSRGWGPNGIVWGHAGRVVDRPVLANGATDFYAQLSQGVDLPVDTGTDLATGVGAALGTRWTMPRAVLEFGVSGDRVERRLFDPSAGPRAPEEELSVRDITSSVGAAWARAVLGPIGLGPLGSMQLSATGTLATSPKGDPDGYIPLRHGRGELRLRRDLFHNSLRAEAALLGEAVSSSVGLFGEIPAQAQLSARIALRIQDLVLYYRSENLLGTTFLTTAFDPDTGFAPTTTRNINVGLSWILVD